MMLTVKNKGSGDLVVSGVAFDPASQTIFSARDVPASLTPQAMRPMTVVFVPERAHEVYDAVLLVRSNDPMHPEVKVPLHGTGGVRKIEVVPASIDFGIVNEGTAPRRSIEIKNTGGDPLIISGVTFTSTSMDLTLVQSGLVRAGGTIQPKTSTVVELVYSPVDLGADRGVVEIASNDETTPVVSVPVTGRANLAPIAVAFECEEPPSPNQIGCDGAALTRQLTSGFRKIVGLDGRMSRDPEGFAISDYRWTIVRKPADSMAVVFFSTNDIAQRKRATGEIEVDKIGSYDLRLIVKDDRGLESFDKPESHVLILPRDLEVALRWDLSADVDLHFVRPGGRPGDYGSGAAGTSTGSDCSAFNRTPNWSDPMSRLDDPSLDKDDVIGRGPEVVSLDFPEDGGTYHVFGHYCDSRHVGVPVDAIVEIYVRGVLQERIPMLDPGLSMRPGELWHAADVTWHAAGPSVVVETSTATPILMPNLCMN
jgi:ASPM-SPD-2-Hydin domain-containing protein